MTHASRRPAVPAVAISLALAAGGLCTGQAAFAVVKPRAALESDGIFPMPPIVVKQVRFWERIFSKYPSTSVVVHESGDPDRIIDVIDFKTLGVRKPGEAVPRKQRDELTKRYLKRYEKAVEHFAKEGKGALRHGAIEERLYDVYKDSPASLKRLYAGDLKVRSQAGLADDFLSAATAAQLYLPYMEKIFTQYGVPTRLTRLPFVESMFNLKARSKVGASGIWQFMPETARNFIFVNSLVDERNSPFKATRAAAQLLLANYRELGSWPLAITAYNHGAVGIAKAVKQVGSDEIGRIIGAYDAASFGFASRNFYAEFLAASQTYDRLARQGQIARPYELPPSETVILQQPMTLQALMQATGLSREALAELNPCLLDTTFTTGLTKPLPAFYEIRVPRGQARAVKTALASMKDRRYARK